MKKLILFAFVASIAFSCGNKKNEKSEKNTEDSTKTTEVKKEPSSKEKFVGNWSFESVNGKEVTEKMKLEVLTLNADGTGLSPNKKAKIEWSVLEKEGKSYLTTKEEKDADTYEIKSLEDKKVVLIDKKDEIVLVKK